MLAIPPNPPSSQDEEQTRGWTRYLARTLRLVAILAVLTGPIQRTWSQSGSTNTQAGYATMCATQGDINDHNPQQSVIHFVAPDKQSLAAEANNVPAPAPVCSKPPIEPPLTIADYKNYIHGHVVTPHSETGPAPLPAPPQTVTEMRLAAAPKRLSQNRQGLVHFAEPSEQDAPVPLLADDFGIGSQHLAPITPIESEQVPSPATEAQHPRDVTFAKPSVLVQESPRMASNASRKSHPITVVAPTHEADADIAEANVRPSVNVSAYDKLQMDRNSQLTDHSSLDSEPNRDSDERLDHSYLRIARISQVTVNSSPDPQRYPAVLAQAPEMPKPEPTPAQPRSESAPAHPESIPLATVDGPAVPLTTSSYLPANSEAYCFRCGVKCPPCGCNPGGPGWGASQPIPWEVFAQGEYVGPARLAHVPVYRLRVDDRLAFVYRLSGQVSGQPYRLNVRDRIQVQSLTAPEVINREVIVEPDGTITLPLLGQVRAAGATLEELSKLLDEQFKRQIKDPQITVTPLEVNSNLQELRSSVDRRYGAGGQVSDARISPDGTVQLPAIGSVPAQGLTLEELEREIKARYAQIVEGLEVTPILTERAPRFVYVVGEVRLPGRFTMEGPTTLMQAIAMAGSWNVGAQLNDVIVFRRDENWQLMATKVNVRSSLIFKKPCPSGEIWLRDSDIVLVPKSPILCADDVINLVFTRGIYGVFPMSASLNFAKLTTL